MTYETVGYTIAALSALALAAHYVNAWAARHVAAAVDTALADTAPVAPVVWGCYEFLTITTEPGWIEELAWIDSLPEVTR